MFFLRFHCYLIQVALNLINENLKYTCIQWNSKYAFIIRVIQFAWKCWYEQLSSSIELDVYLGKHVLKVSKSQKHFFLKLHCPKSYLNFWQISALTSKMGQIKMK